MLGTRRRTGSRKQEKYVLFYDGERVSWKVGLALKHPNKRLEHPASRSSSSGGSNYYYCGKHHEFVSLVKDLAWPEEITQ